MTDLLLPCRTFFLCSRQFQLRCVLPSQQFPFLDVYCCYPTFSPPALRSTDILATKPDMFVRGSLKEDKNWQGTDAAQEQEGRLYHGGEEYGAFTHTCTSINAPALTVFSV
jgi:hypothetical protein